MKNKIPAFVVLVSSLVSIPCWANDDGLWSGIKTNWLGLEPKAKPFYFRAGYTQLSPDSSSSEVFLSDVGGPASLAIENGPIEGSGAEVEDTDFVSAIIGYQFGSGPWAIETVLAMPLTIEFSATGTLASESIAPTAVNVGNVPTGVPPLGSEFGETKALPPVVTLTYRFRLDKALRPYLGAGLTYMITYDSEVTNPVLTEVNEPDLEIDDAFGYVLQGGVEYNFLGDWWVNFDVKYVALETSAKVTNINVKTPDLATYGEARVGNADIDITVDPWLYHIGFGFHF